MIPTDEQLSAKYRWIPFLGFRKLDEVDKYIYEIPQEYEITALVFEWLGFLLVIAGRGVKKDTDAN